MQHIIEAEFSEWNDIFLYVVNSRDKLISSDINMVVMDGITLFEEASTIFPKLNRRFLFISGNMTQSRQGYFRDKNIQFLAKPVPIKILRKSAFNILLSNTPS